MRLFLLIFIFFKGQIIFASEFPNLFGCLCEGGLITGKISKNDQISIDGIKMKTFNNGEFIFAFGRKHKGEIIIKFNNTQKIFKVKKKVQNRKNKWSSPKKS